MPCVRLCQEPRFLHWISLCFSGSCLIRGGINDITMTLTHFQSQKGRSVTVKVTYSHHLHITAYIVIDLCHPLLIYIIMSKEGWQLHRQGQRTTVSKDLLQTMYVGLSHLTVRTASGMIVSEWAGYNYCLWFPLCMCALHIFFLRVNLMSWQSSNDVHFKDRYCMVNTMHMNCIGIVGYLMLF